jgi:hypothetical protein
MKTKKQKIQNRTPFLGKMHLNVVKLQKLANKTSVTSYIDDTLGILVIGLLLEFLVFRGESLLLRASGGI